MNQKSKLYIGIISITLAVAGLIYGTMVESTIDRPDAQRDVYIGSAALAALGIFRLYTYYKKK